ncbi:MAG: hypothetical protein HRT66_00990 [Flavobacteriaceae bacterium]|nr:hypothetical protein [Flavobacteriaceae bacterium]
MKHLYIYTLIFTFIISCKTEKNNDIILEDINTRKPIIRISLSNKFIAKNFSDISQIKFEEGSKILHLHKINNKGEASNTSVIGKYSIVDGFLVYKPMFYLGYGLEFEVQTNTESGHNKLRLTIPKRVIPKEKGMVISSFPKQNNIPYNIIYFHFLFSIDMSEVKSVNHTIKVYEEGREIMWNEKRVKWLSPRHMYMSVHPSGLKHGGHNPKSKLQPAFFEGRKYRIVITDSLVDKYGRKLKQEYTQNFTATGIDMTNPRLISKSRPEINTRKPIKITFSEIIDYGSLLLNFRIINKKNKPIKGKIKHTNKGSIWSFVPDENWKSVDYSIDKSSAIMDLSGNSN